MKTIKEIEIKELKLLCVDLVSKTLVELGQSKTDKEIVILATSLAEDLKEDFYKLYFIDIQKQTKRIRTWPQIRNQRALPGCSNLSRLICRHISRPPWQLAAHTRLVSLPALWHPLAVPGFPCVRRGPVPQFQPAY